MSAWTDIAEMAVQLPELAKRLDRIERKVDRLITGLVADDPAVSATLRVSGTRPKRPRESATAN